MTTSEEERQQRWQEYFCEVFGGAIVNVNALAGSVVDPPARVTALDVGPEKTEAAIKRLKRHRGVGRVEVPAELLQAGGSAIAVKISELYQRVADTEQWVTNWCGGKIVDVYKRNGHHSDCDCSRGILLTDHIGKGLSELLSEHVDSKYNAEMPSEQFDATAGCGTDFASPIVRSFL